MVLLRRSKRVKTTSPTAQNTYVTHLERPRSLSNSNVGPRTSIKRFHRLHVRDATVAARHPIGRNRTQPELTGPVPTHCPTPGQPQATASQPEAAASHMRRVSDAFRQTSDPRARTQRTARVAASTRFAAAAEAVEVAAPLVMPKRKVHHRRVWSRTRQVSSGATLCVHPVGRSTPDDQSRHCRRAGFERRGSDAC